MHRDTPLPIEKMIRHVSYSRSSKWIPIFTDYGLPYCNVLRRTSGEKSWYMRLELYP